MGRGDHPETFLLKALCCHRSPSWLKVMGGWWWWVVACEIIMSSPGTLFPFPIPVPVAWQYTFCNVGSVENVVPRTRCETIRWCQKIASSTFPDEPQLWGWNYHGKMNIHQIQRFKFKSYDFLVDEGRVTGQGTQHDLLKVPGRRLRGAGHLCWPENRQDSGQRRLQEAGSSRWFLIKLITAHHFHTFVVFSLFLSSK